MIFRTSLSAVLLMALVGCGTGESIPEVVMVSGKLTMDGEPLENIKVTFMPEATEDKRDVRSSWGTTDATGKFTLTYGAPGQTIEGAAAGQHKVVLYDMVPNDSRDVDATPDDIENESTESRIHSVYTNASTTRLEAKVAAPGPQEINFDIKGN